MDTELFNLAIETSSRRGSIALGQGDRVLEARDLPEPRRHRVDLMSVINALCLDHHVAPRTVKEIYVSIGPGSFTGLRIGVTTAKTLAWVLNARVVAVPTLDAVALGMPPNAAGDAEPAAPSRTLPNTRILVGLNLKGDSLYGAVYHWTGEAWEPTNDPKVAPLAEWLADAPRPTAVLADPCPERPADMTRVDPAWARATATAVHALGRRAARQGRFDDPWRLTPFYARLPEAVTLWEQRSQR